MDVPELSNAAAAVLAVAPEPTMRTDCGWSEFCARQAF